MEKVVNEKISMKTKELSFLKKLAQMYWVNPKSWILDEFALEDGLLTVKTRKGNTIQSPMSEIKATYGLDKNGRYEMYLKDGNGKKLHFKEIPWMLSDDEWELIFSTLDPQKSKLFQFTNLFGGVLGAARN